MKNKKIIKVLLPRIILVIKISERIIKIKRIIKIRKKKKKK